MTLRWRTYIGWLALLLALTACPSDPPEVLVATATGQPAQSSGDFDPYSRDNPAPAFSTVTTGALRITLLSFERSLASPDALLLEPAPQGSELAILDLRVECLEGDGHCDLTISEFQLLSDEHNYFPVDEFSSSETLIPGPMQQGDVQQTTLYYYLPQDQTDFVFRFIPLDDLWVETIYIALPQ